jgi:CheY-like chemotaxis protein
MLGQSLPSSGDSQEEMGRVNVLEASLDSPSTDENLSISPLQLGIRSDLMLNPESNVNLSHSFGQSGLLTSFMGAGTTIAQTLTGEPLSCATLTSPWPSPASPPLMSPLSSLETMAITTTPGAMNSLDPTVVLSTVVSDPTLLITSTVASSAAAPTKPGKIDLILMDCAMPVKSGFDAASEIRAMGLSSEFAANIPIIALTASAVPSTKEKCIASGMNAYMSKPTKLADLEAMLNQWIT